MNIKSLRKSAFSILTALLLFLQPAEAQDCFNHQPESMKPLQGWEDVKMEGMNREELLKVLGCPPHIVRMTSVRGSEHNRELWVYHPYDKDSTALHVWLKGDIFHQSALDSFMGFWTHHMDNPDFWE